MLVSFLGLKYMRSLYRALVLFCKGHSLYMWEKATPDKIDLYQQYLCYTSNTLQRCRVIVSTQITVQPGASLTIDMSRFFPPESPILANNSEINQGMLNATNTTTAPTLQTTSALQTTDHDLLGNSSDQLVNSTGEQDDGKGSLVLFKTIHCFVSSYS